MEGTLPGKLCAPFKHSDSECHAHRPRADSRLKSTAKKQKKPGRFWGVRASCGARLCGLRGGCGNDFGLRNELVAFLDPRVGFRAEMLVHQHAG